MLNTSNTSANVETLATRGAAWSVAGRRYSLAMAGWLNFHLRCLDGSGAVGSRWFDAAVSKTMLNDYGVKSEWGEVSQQLARVWADRLRLWASVGAYEGLRVDRECVLPSRAAELLAGLDNSTVKLLTELGGLVVNRDARNALGLRAREYWTLSFIPGAIISAAQHRDNDGEPTYEGCACFADGAEYEGTAGQMAFDPHIAVLERRAADGKRVTGFQMVALTSTGIHGYGARYNGNNINSSDASTLCRLLAAQLFGGCKVAENSDVNARALRNLATMAAATGCEGIPVPSAEKNVFNSSACFRPDMPPCLVDMYSKLRGFPGLPALEWTPVYDVTQAYEETLHPGAYFYTGIDSNYSARRLDNYQISDLLTGAGIVSGPDACCEECGEPIYFDDSEYENGEDYGLGDVIFCCETCVSRAMYDAADETLNGVALIDGSLWAIPEW